MRRRVLRSEGELAASKAQLAELSERMDTMMREDGARRAELGTIREVQRAQADKVRELLRVEVTATRNVMAEETRLEERLAALQEAVDAPIVSAGSTSRPPVGSYESPRAASSPSSLRAAGGAVRAQVSLAREAQAHR